MVLQHVMALVNAGYTKAEIEKMTSVEEPKAEAPKAEEPKAEEPKAKEPKADSFSFDYDKLSHSMLKAFQSANIRQSQQPTQEKTDLSKFF